VGRLAVLDERTRDQEDYLSVLTTLIERYEAEHYAKEFDGVAALDALKFLLEEHGMNGSDLGRLLGCRTLGAAILRGDRGLSRKHILALARHFRVDPGVFLD
jgi:HTH-type transcriptional regulator/antitoxin HigA